MIWETGVRQIWLPLIKLGPETWISPCLLHKMKQIFKPMCKATQERAQAGTWLALFKRLAMTMGKKKKREHGRTWSLSIARQEVNAARRRHDGGIKRRITWAPRNRRKHSKNLQKQGWNFRHLIPAAHKKLEASGDGLHPFGWPQLKDLGTEGILSLKNFATEWPPPAKWCWNNC